MQGHSFNPLSPLQVIGLVAKSKVDLYKPCWMSSRSSIVRSTSHKESNS